MPKTKPLPDLCQYDKAECAPKNRASKDKRHWCKGKVGVRHKVKWEITNEQFGRKELLCITCGKHMDWYHRPWRKRSATNFNVYAESEADYSERCKKAWSDKQAEAKRRLAYYLEYVD